MRHLDTAFAEPLGSSKNFNAIWISRRAPYIPTVVGELLPKRKKTWMENWKNKSAAKIASRGVARNDSKATTSSKEFKSNLSPNFHFGKKGISPFFSKLTFDLLYLCLCGCFCIDEYTAKCDEHYEH